MNKLKTLYSKEIWLNETRRIFLKYILIENEASFFEIDNMNVVEKEDLNLDSEESKVYYGIRIEQELDDIVEADEVEGISYSEEEVLCMIKTLYEYDVTPISMIEVIDNIITESNLPI